MLFFLKDIKIDNRMQIFELHFNPGAKEDLIFDSFCYEAGNIFEKRVGNLYMVGFLKNSLPQNSRFLDKLAKTIKERFYGFSAHSPEKALKESLRRANEFLEKIARMGDVSWLGNLNFAVISLKDFDLNFTKIGNLKVLLLRGGQIVDIDKSLDLQGIEPYPLKIFNNIVAGNLAEEDKILVLTEEVFQSFSSENILTQIAELIPFDEKGLKKILKQSEEKLLKVLGTCLIIKATKKTQPLRPLTFRKEPEKFLISKVFIDLGKNVARKISAIPKKAAKAFSPAPLLAPFLKIVKVRPHISLKIPNPFKKIKNKETAQKEVIPKKSILKETIPEKIFPEKILPKITLPSFKIPEIKMISLPSPKKFLRPAEILRKIFLRERVNFRKKNLISVLVFISILFIGFLIFNLERRQDIKLAQAELEEIRLKEVKAENLLALNDGNGANTLLQEAWNDVLPRTKIGSLLRNEALLLKNSIEEKLAPLNNLEKIAEPESIFEFKLQETDFIPQKILSIDDDLCFFNQFSSKIYKLNVKNGEKEIISAGSSLKLGRVFDDSLLFFSKPKILILRNNEWREKNLELPTGDFGFDYFSLLRGNLYFLDIQSGKIIKYPYSGDFSWGTPQIWMKPSERTIGAKSMTVDGSIWILTKENSIERYYAGAFQQTLNLKLFPYPEDFSKIFIDPTLPYLYVLEPSQKRIIVLDKSGDIIKQFQSEKFDSLMDFAIADYGRTIYLLNGSKVYKINL